MSLTRVVNLLLWSSPKLGILGLCDEMRVLDEAVGTVGTFEF